MFVPTFKILSHVVPEKSLMEKKVYRQTDKLTSLLKRQKLYTPYIFLYRGDKQQFEEVPATEKPLTILLYTLLHDGIINSHL